MRRRDFPADSIEGRAYRRVRTKLFFYKHAVVFAVVNLALYLRAEFSGRPHGHVVIWGWAIALAIHGVLTVIRLQSEGLRERMLREEIERMKRDSDKK
jgi:hypothetical protein